MFRIGEMVKVLINSEYGMVVDIHKSPTDGYITGYSVRLPDYRIVSFRECELAKRDDSETKQLLTEVKE